MIFLIEFNRAAQERVTYKTYGDDQFDAAMSDLRELELQRFDEGVENEIVVLQAVDEEQLKRTHGRYFSKLAPESVEKLAAQMKILEAQRSPGSTGG